ncbi:pyridoxamine 5'-phosphate oxidase family protein [Dyella silvatica]|uniref:pyridoxamine 5'-phosphate oxidase family protein n=1 Tax=Dyella silvatica TaxID=2992128 RepID=UPI00225B99F8|nr:pyridoxamine 5'-phosphate oxidase family protein [Dyella silvatica]
MTPHQYLEQARAIVASCQLCFVLTPNGGEVNARVVQHLKVDDDLSVQFMTSRKTRKIRELTRAGSLSLTFLDEAGRSYVTLGGDASVSDDPALKNALWRETLRPWFPDGPHHPDVVAVTCRPRWIELWSLSRGVAPEPKGLNSIRLVQSPTGWKTTVTSPPDADEVHRLESAGVSEISSA